MNQYILSNARIVTPTEDFLGSLVIEQGVITEVIRGKTYREGEDLKGYWLTPGCIDIHSDYLEKEIHPRPGANFPLPMAFHFMDQRAAACGITAVFSAISFSENQERDRTFDNAIKRAQIIQLLSQSSLIRQYLHARLDPNTEEVVHYLDKMKEITCLRLVVYNENVPGQRQFKLEDLVKKQARMKAISEEEARSALEEKIEELKKINKRMEIYASLQDTILLGSHDDTTEAHVEEAFQFGATLSEMPTTIEAARKAKALGMSVCMGAPNYVRGGSHCGNLSCHEALQEGLVDMLCSDYHFPTLLTAVIKMMQENISPSEAINYVSLNPARFLQMDETIGSIEPGKSADLVCFKAENRFAKVFGLWVEGVKKYAAEHVSISENMTETASTQMI